MNNFKRVALNITSKFGLLNSHRTLILAISEEREVHETLLKLVLARVNASTSLLKWAKKEDNQIMKETVLRLYDISLMYASVQREFAEQSNKVTNSLKDILSYEVTLDSLEKRLKEVREKKEKLEKIASEGGRRRSNVSNHNPDEMLRLKDEEDNLKKDLEAKRIQAEIYKNTSMKSSLMSVCEAHLKFAEKMSLIFTAAKEVINIMKDVPDHVKPSYNHQKLDNSPKCDAVVDLAKALNITKPLSSNMGNPSSIFHVELNRVGLSADNDIKANNININKLNKEDLKKSISNPVLLSPPPRPTISIAREEEPSISERPVVPPLPDFVVRRRSRTNDVFWSHAHATGDEMVSKRSSYGLNNNEYDEIGNVDLGPAESFGRLYRSASDSTISSSKTDEYRYSEPWEEIDVEKEKVIEALDKQLAHKTKSFIGTKYESIEKFNEKGNRDFEKYGEERIYTEPIMESESDHVEPDIDSNTEYVDNDLIHEPLKSKLSILENIVLTNAPAPPIKPKPPKKLFASASVRLPEGPKKVPPKPKPRPTTALYEGTKQSKQTENNTTGNDNLQRSAVGSVREIAAQMSGKIQPASLVPSMTQAKLKEQENSEYQNINFS